MGTWQSIPTLVGIGAASVRRFAASAGLTESNLRQSDWEAIPFFSPLVSEEQAFDWELHTYALYRVRTASKLLWLFWLGIKEWQPGAMLPMSPEVVACWQRVEEMMTTPCSHRACLNPALVWPSPAMSMTIQIDGQSRTQDFYGCGEAHRQALSQVETLTIELSAHTTAVARDTIHLEPAERTQAGQRPKVSERRGRIPGCSYDQWIIKIPDLWLPEEIELVEETLRARLQEHYDHFHEYSGGFWRLSVSYNHQEFFARYGSTELEGATAEALANAITQDYTALRQSWQR